MSSVEVNAKAISEDFEFQALNQAVNYRKKSRDDFAAYLRGGVLEVGEGIGQFSAELDCMTAIKLLTLLEPDARFYERLRLKYNHHNVINGTAGSLQRADYDSIISINVLEHIKKDGKEIEVYSKLLKRGGYLCLFVPACPSIYAPIDRSFGHFRRYTKKGLTSLLLASDLQIVDLRYFNITGYFLWWLNFCVFRKMEFGALKVRLFDKHIFPFTQAFESKVRLPFGQSLVAIARKAQ
ncbi:MAG: methyltransferase domain-containing protein [Verrucomicrobiota bacterium]